MTADHLDAGQASRPLTYTLRPVPDAEGGISGIDVTVELEAAADEPLLELRHVAMNVATPASEIVLRATDAAGELPITAADADAAGHRVRQWRPGRAPAGPVTARCSIRVPDEVAALGVAPPLELRDEGGAVSGGAAATLPRPPGGVWSIRLAWDLSLLPEGSSGSSSLGGRAHEMPANELDQVFFAAGALHRYPAGLVADDRSGYSAAWHGEPHFDVDAMMRWGERLHGRMSQFFDAPGADYRVFLRSNDINPGGGIGMRDSFLMTFGRADANITEAEMRFTLSHEMFHTFQPMVEGDGGVSDSLAHSWFNEGLAVYFQGTMPYRHGMVTRQEFVDDVNVYAARFATNVFAQLPNSEVPGRFWSDTRVRTLPYDRGFLYFAGVAEALREAGAASLEDLVRELRARQREGEVTTTDAWASLMARELGDAGVLMLEEHLAGRITTPSSSAFGSEFRHVERELRRYELGFDPVVLTESPRIVRGLIAGSAAQEAGLRDGDEILRPVGQDRLQGDQHATLTLEIRRDGETSSVTYLPRGERMRVTLWEVAA